ncbi:MAG: hypothetical protein ABSG50_10415 [Opitutaceae bacterium]|jgi:hypothetical protein
MNRPNRRQSLLLLGIAVILSACAATGLRYSEHPVSSTPVPAHAARLTVYRVNDSLLYSARSARLKLDGRNVGALAPGGFKTFEVPPGTHTFRVDMWDAPGRWELTIEVQAGLAYFYEVAPRAASAVAAMPGVALMNNTPAGTLLGGAAMLGGMAAESAVRQRGGAFSLMPVEQSLAVPKLMELRESK